MSGLCGTCRWWIKNATDAGPELPDHWIASFSDQEFAPCVLLPSTARLNNFSLSETGQPTDLRDAALMREHFAELHAYTADASQYSALLMCDANFGCVHYEERS